MSVTENIKRMVCINVLAMIKAYWSAKTDNDHLLCVLVYTKRCCIIHEPKTSEHH